MFHVETNSTGVTALYEEASVKHIAILFSLV